MLALAGQILKNTPVGPSLGLDFSRSDTQSYHDPDTSFRASTTRILMCSHEFEWYMLSRQVLEPIDNQQSM